MDLEYLPNSIPELGPLNAQLKKFYDTHLFRAHQLDAAAIQNELNEQIQQILIRDSSKRYQLNELLLTENFQRTIHAIAWLLKAKDGKGLVMTLLGNERVERACKAAEMPVYPVTIDQMGMCMDALERLCEAGKVQVVFVMPRSDFPTTMTLHESRIQELLQLQKTYGFYIVENDPYADLYMKHPYTSAPLFTVATQKMIKRIKVVQEEAKAILNAAAHWRFYQGTLDPGLFFLCHTEILLPGWG